MVDKSLVLQCKGLTVAHGKRTLLHSFSTDFYSGEFVAIAGENGCGKSTLLAQLSGVTSVNGALSIAGKAAQQWSLEHLSRVRAVMQQQAAMPFGFSVEDIIGFSRHQYIESLSDKRERIGNIAELLDVSHLLSRNIQSLSGGERQRAFLAKALLQLLPTGNISRKELEGKILLLDEPTSALDFRHQKAVMQVLKHCSECGLCIVCVSHDLNLITPYCTRILLLGEQRCLADGTPENVLNTNNLNQCFKTSLNLLINKDKVFITL